MAQNNKIPSWLKQLGGKLANGLDNLASKLRKGVKVPKEELTAAQKAAKQVENISASLKSGAKGTLLKVVPAVIILSDLDQTIRSTPLIDEVYKKVEKFYQWEVFETFSKLGGFGEFVGKIHVKINDFVSGGAYSRDLRENFGNKYDKFINDPKFYENLGVHTKFQIPLAYPDKVLPSIGLSGDVTQRSSFIIMRLLYNPSFARDEESARLTQVLDLLKGVRGLSGNLSYNIKDLHDYLLNSLYLINEYYRLKFCLQLSSQYSLMKSPLQPESLIAQLGFTDMIENKALYQTILTDMYKFINNTVPMWSTLMRKIPTYWNCFISDSSDLHVAVYYKHELNIITTLVGNGNVNTDTFGKCFKRTKAGIEQDGRVEILKSELEGKVSYSSYQSYFQVYKQAFYKGTKWDSIRGDLYGAFGQAVIWNDNMSLQNDSMFNRYDELALLTINNANLIDQSILVQATVDTSDIFVNCDLESLSINLSLNEEEDDVGLTGKIIGTYKASAQQVSAVKNYAFPAIEGIDSVNGRIRSNVSFNSHKLDLSEGEALEMLTLKSIATDVTTPSVSGDSITATITYASFDAILVTATVLGFQATITNGDTTDVQTYASPIRPRPIYIGMSDALLWNAELNNIALMTVWSQSDWLFKLPITYTYSSGASTQWLVNNVMLWDYNILGSLSGSALNAARTYIGYSLFAAGINSEGKRIDNLVTAYNQIANS